MRIALRLLCCLVIASAAITVWTRAALVFALGPQLTSVCLWIAAGGSLCAVLTLACTRKPKRRQQPRPDPYAGYVVGGQRDRAMAGHSRPGNPPARTEPGTPREFHLPRAGSPNRSR